MCRYASTPATVCETELDERLQHTILMEDPDVVIDLRELSFNNSDKNSIFWKQCELCLQAVHEHRHDSTTYLACALSVIDLTEQIANKCPLYHLCSGYVFNFIQKILELTQLG